MSPSPQDARHADAVRNYADAWRAIMQLVRSGFSWSGHERNCVFLNCTEPGGREGIVPQFVDISGISGLGFPDDGRSVAVVDWDHDGDLDVWLRNRSAPRLRLMRNLSNAIAPENQSISVHLIGSTCNRDAIGARAELVLKTGEPKGRRLVRSVRAGDAFLSQSSKWLHFGVKKGVVVDELIVDWPGGDRERFRGLSAAARYEIRQGTGQATPLDQRSTVSLAAQPYAPMPPSAAARIVLPGKIALPPIATQGNGSVDYLRYDNSETPTLLMFWTSSCPNCRRELTDLAKHRSEVERAGLRVIAVCLDGLDQTADADAANDDSEFLRSIEFPFQSVRTDHETVELLSQFQQALFGNHPGFVVPLSFVVDSQGHVVSIYRGSYSHDIFLQDRALADLDDETLRTLATPLLGTWITKPATRSQFAEFVGARLIPTQPSAAVRYFKLAVGAEDDPSRQGALRAQLEQLQRSLQQESKD